jgi:hypothetical protein
MKESTSLGASTKLRKAIISFVKSVHENTLKTQLRLDKLSRNHENNEQDALYRLIYYFMSALHVSGDVFAHHQEHLTVFTVSGNVHPS